MEADLEVIMQPDEQIVFFDYEISNLLLKSIDNAQKEVIIVSPYLKFWPHLTESIERARHRGVQFRLHYREDKKDELDHTQLRALFHTCIPVPILHAKLYFFDDEMIMSSMNLHQYSQQSSKEIAVRLIDPRQKEEVRKYLKERLTPIRISKPIETNNARVNEKAVYPPKQVQKEPPIKEERSVFSQAVGFVKKAIEQFTEEPPGFCVRCGKEVKFDPGRPFCSSCYAKWSQYGDPKYQEKYCHGCGKPHKTSMLKPLCYECYKEVV